MADDQNKTMLSEEKDEEMEDVEDESDSDEDSDGASDGGKEAYLPGTPMADDEELVCDESAYIMYHQAQTGAPCLSFDVLPDSLGDCRTSYPQTMYLVAGTQAQRAHINNIILLRMSNLHRTSKDKDEEEGEDDVEDVSGDEGEREKKPALHAAMMKHNGGINRVRCTYRNGCPLAASWSEQGKVYIWDLAPALHAVDNPHTLPQYNQSKEATQPLYKFTGHQTEGYAMDWSTVAQGNLLTGDCTKNIHLWQPQEAGTWHVDQRPFQGHTASVEDVQWSPNEASVFASCSVDKSVRVWDTRAKPSQACMITAAEAHSRDVNVISWNHKEPFIVSGGDDGHLKIWDLRQIQSGKPVAVFKHHTSPITSVEWHPTDSSVFAASGSDDQLTLWDLAVERDAEATMGSEAEPEVPPQLLFIHQGQQDIKEVHWHRQLPGTIISTAHSGFNVFRTISV